MSLSKSEAARLNGAKSRGPVTPEGKSKSAMNSLKHGLCSKQVVLPHEDKEAFERMRHSYHNRFRPIDDLEAGLVDELANNSNTLQILLRYGSQFGRDFARVLKQIQDLQQAHRRQSVVRQIEEETRPTLQAPVLPNEPTEPSYQRPPAFISGQISVPQPSSSPQNPIQEVSDPPQHT